MTQLCPDQRRDSLMGLKKILLKWGRCGFIPEVHWKQILVVKNVRLLIFHVCNSHLRYLTLWSAALFKGVSLQISQYHVSWGEERAEGQNG